MQVSMIRACAAEMSEVEGLSTQSCLRSASAGKPSTELRTAGSGESEMSEPTMKENLKWEEAS